MALPADQLSRVPPPEDPHHVLVESPATDGQTDDFWQYALYAAVAFIRAAASRANVPVRQVCQELALRAGSQPE
jgi:hypothetical protein